MVEKKRIKELIALMKQSGARRLKVRDKDFEIEVELGSAPLNVPDDLGSNPMQKSMDHHRQEVSPSPESQEKEGLSGTYATAPMVGTFYTAASPDTEAFVKVGDTIKSGDVVCIIEAMKVMNEVKSEVSGTVLKILVEDGHPVEYGTKLFQVQES